ncbi:LPXTG cell wall anchor domain-containing protein [Streptomyces sp. SLBN-118]|uniref:LPXTG cell wall anchor domain-containing protein n=1 Tax=Streptomyces sp. SLBN-118 TaxID=2768454 RepID=UPI0021B2D626|nr:LPXTG cell wall anchor domain-containing protein [Streptomyces sp. SLBN-118]
MAVAAATAVIAPAAFLTAPAAYADDPSPTPTDTASSSPSETAGTPSETAGTPSETATAPAAAQSSTPAATPSTSAASSSAPATTPSPSATTPDEFPCDLNEEPKFDKSLQTSLSGLPSKIVAGSGYHEFKLNVSNKGESSYKRVDLGVFAAQIDEDTWNEVTGHLSLQYKDPESGKWTAISLDENDEGAGYLGYTDVKAKESFSIDLRLSVDKSAPAGFGYAISIGIYADDKGNCVFSDDESYYEFDILAAGAKPGDVDDAEPQEGGKKPLPSKKPAGNTEIQPQGNLASTGSNSMLPTVGIAGGIAIVAGAGVVFAMKRRRSGDAAA